MSGMPAAAEASAPSGETAQDEAQRLAQIGWFVFPCRANKKPFTEHGHKDATRDPQQIRAWWTRWQDAQVGVACGASGLCVVDLDVAAVEAGRPARNGLDAFMALCDLRQHECDLIARTPRGGQHLFFRMPNPPLGIGVDLGRKHSGIDLRGEGGYVIAPSPASPRREWIDGLPRPAAELSSPPEWLFEWLAKETAERSTAAPPHDLPIAERERIECSSALFAIPPSVSRPVWLQAIFAAHAKLDSAAWGADLVEKWSSLTTVSGQYNPGEATRIYGNAALPETAPPGELVDRETLFALAHGYGWRAAGVEAEDDVEIRIGRALKPMPEPDATAAKPPPVRASDEEKNIIECWLWRNVADLPPLDEQVEGAFPTQSLVVFAGDPESGKSTIAIDLALHMVHGMDWLGRRVEPGSVLYLAGEGHAGIAGRLRAWRAWHPDVGPDEEQGRYLHIANGIPSLTKKNREIVQKLVADVTKEQGHAPSLVIVDTLSQALDDGDENAGEDVGPVLRTLSDLRKAFGCTVLIIHHLNKPQKGSPIPWGINLIRGHGKLKGDPDACLGLFHDSVDGVRRLDVWKLKDLEKGEPLTMRLLPVETGRRRKNGNLERACIVIPDAGRALVSSNEEEERRHAVRRRRIDELEMRVVAGLRELGSARTATDVVAAISGRRGDLFAAFGRAIAHGRIVDVGTAKTPKFAVADEPEMGGVEESTKEGPREPGTCGPIPGTPVVPGNQTGTGGNQESASEADPPPVALSLPRAAPTGRTRSKRRGAKK